MQQRAEGVCLVIGEKKFFLSLTWIKSCVHDGQHGKKYRISLKKMCVKIRSFFSTIYKNSIYVQKMSRSHRSSVPPPSFTPFHYRSPIVRSRDCEYAEEKKKKKKKTVRSEMDWRFKPTSKLTARMFVKRRRNKYIHWFMSGFTLLCWI